MNYCHFFPQSYNRKERTAEGQMEIPTNSSIFLYNSYLFLQAFVGLLPDFNMSVIELSLVFILYYYLEK